MANCSNCNCNPCSCDCSCDPENEAFSSAFNNFQVKFVGPITKTCVNGAVVWTLPCGLDDAEPVTGYPKLSGETVFCYFLRVLQNFDTIVSGFETPVPVSNGGTGATNAAEAVINLGAQAQCDELDEICATGWQDGDLVYRNSILTRLPAGTAGQVLTMSGGFPAWASPSSGLGQYIILADQKPSGTHGGTSATNTWNLRDLNTVVYDSDSNVASLSGNRFELLPGVYRIHIRSQQLGPDSMMLKLVNFTDTVDVLTGDSAHGVGASSEGNIANLTGRFTAIAAKEYRIEQWSDTGRVTNGFGDAVTRPGIVEQYLTIELWKE